MKLIDNFTTITSADFSRQALLRTFRKKKTSPHVRETSSDKGHYLSILYLLHLHQPFRIAIGLWFALQPYPRSNALYEVSVRQVRCLLPASFWFQLAMDTIAIGYVIPAIRAYSGLTPVR